MNGKYTPSKRAVMNVKVAWSSDAGALPAGAVTTISVPWTCPDGYVPAGIRTLRIGANKLVVAGWRIYSTSVQLIIYNADTGAHSVTVDLSITVVNNDFAYAMQA